MGNRKRIRIIREILFAGTIICLVKIGQIYNISVKHSKQQEQLKKMTEMSENLDEDVRGSLEGQKNRTADTEKTGGVQEAETETAMLSQYASLYAENEDLAGWLFIEGTNIDYPVMQCEDDEYYLKHDFYGAESKYGCLYVKQEADPERGTNFIIYGHNMKDGSMFGELDLYEKESYYWEHPVVSFHTLYEKRIYEIIAVFPSQVYGREEDVFKYYEFYEADSETEFYEFYNMIKELSLYDTGVEAVFGDTFLTMSTCAYHVEDGRFVVIARQRDGEA